MTAGEKGTYGVGMSKPSGQQPGMRRSAKGASVSTNKRSKAKSRKRGY